MNYAFALSKVEALLTKLVAALAANAVIRLADVQLFDKACSDLFALRMAPNHALRYACIKAIAQADAVLDRQQAKHELFLVQKAEALKAQESRDAARLVRRELWNAGKAESDRRASERKASKPAVKAGSWRKDFADIEAAMLAPRAEAE